MLERDGQFVHRAFERIDAVRRAGRAHVARGREIEPDDLVREADVVALVEQARPVITASM